MKRSELKTYPVRTEMVDCTAVVKAMTDLGSRAYVEIKVTTGGGGVTTIALTTEQACALCESIRVQANKAVSWNADK